jgi:hypothetical protein
MADQHGHHYQQYKAMEHHNHHHQHSSGSKSEEANNNNNGTIKNTSSSSSYEDTIDYDDSIQNHDLKESKKGASSTSDYIKSFPPRTTYDEHHQASYNGSLNVSNNVNDDYRLTSIDERKMQQHDEGNSNDMRMNYASSDDMNQNAASSDHGEKMNSGSEDEGEMSRDGSILLYDKFLIVFSHD